MISTCPPRISFSQDSKRRDRYQRLFDPVEIVQILLITITAFFFFAGTANSYDLNAARKEVLSNGLTVLVYEDHLQPLVSTQVLYKAGARNEYVGSTGLAHFLEHMAFRSTKHFPNTIEPIYAAGGEWHGYTWIDETTYFETVPIESLDFVLQLQADRMFHVENRKEEVEAERGAVLTELHSYENDPSSVLYDQVIALSFLEHPYRYNTIGWTSDVEAITHSDLVDFYERFYSPSNAVLAIAGDVSFDDVLSKVHKYFGKIPAKEVEELPRTVEPPQKGIRRVQLDGDSSSHYFQITYRAPAATDSDYPAFLLLQDILAGSGGVNFSQSGFSVSAQEGTRLAGIGERISTFFTATAQPYVFNISGRVKTSASPKEIETQIEDRIHDVRENGVTQEEMEKARAHLQTELIFDLETTEDVAHQMAYFEGIGAFEILQKLPALLSEVKAEQVREAARKWLGPEKRTIGWYLGKSGERQSGQLHNSRRPAAAKDDRRSVSRFSIPAPRLIRLKNGLPAIVHRVPRSAAGYLRILVPSNHVEAEGANYSADTPVWRYTSVDWKFRPEDLESTIRNAGKLFPDSVRFSNATEHPSEDPEEHLNQVFREMIGDRPRKPSTPGPALITIVGDIDETQTVALLQEVFGRLKPPHYQSTKLHIQERNRTVRIPGKAQSQFGYAIPAPAPTDRKSYAYRLLLYVMTHGYGGRLGNELITRTGLIYYISSNYHSDGNASWISISFGVNPDRLQAARETFERLMNELRDHPPDATELKAAKQHLIGRRNTAYQSNEELTAFYAREWIEQGTLLDLDEFENRVDSMQLKDLIKITPEFLSGVTAIVDTNP